MQAERALASQSEFGATGMVGTSDRELIICHSSIGQRATVHEWKEARAILQTARTILHGEVG